MPATHSRALSKSAPWNTTSAPSPRIAATLPGLAPSGTAMVARTPCARAAKAMLWPWFPVEAVNSPDARSLALNCATRFSPPRTLNAPTGRWFSCFTHTLAPISALRPAYRYSGVGLR